MKGIKMRNGAQHDYGIRAIFIANGVWKYIPVSIDFSFYPALSGVVVDDFDSQ